MRESREKDWKAAGVSESTYARWMGHSIPIARKHYDSGAPTLEELAIAAA